MVDRREVLLGALAGTVCLNHGAWAQDAAPAAQFRAVAADARPLAAKGAPGAAGVIQRLLPGKLQTVFADRLAPANKAAPVLLARIDTLYMSAFADLPTPGIDSFGSMDSMEGAGLVMAGNRTVSETPLRVTLPAGYSGAYYLPDIDTRRLDSLCYQFAYWLRREMNL